MALGIIFWVFWISLLADSNVGSSATKGYGYSYGYQYPFKARLSKLVDDGNKVLTSDRNNQQGVDKQPAGFVYKHHNKPSAEQQQNLAPNQQNLQNTLPNAERFAKQQIQPNAQSSPKVEGLVNGETRQWGPVNLNKPLLFPLKSSYEVADPSAAKPRSTPFNVYTSTLPHSTSTSETAHTSQTAYNEPASPSTFQAVASPRLWQPEPVGNGIGVSDSGFDYRGQDLSSVSSAYSYPRNKPNLFFEEVFQYPSKSTEPPQSSGPVSNAVGGYSGGYATRHASTPVTLSFPNNIQAQPFYKSWRGVPSLSKLIGGGNLKFNQMFRRPQNAVFSPPRVKVPARVKVYQNVMAPSRGYQPILHHPRPSSYIVLSRSSYQKGRYIQSKTRYTPEYPLSGLEGVIEPAHN
ncbi:uncharacterized protein LOC115783906 [Archocentrus centrarchus]|uniref:uncharacterized protein LOC115783906 n=1 Tax=Archocentrus centrarchus TaxID=63155 RepID=UPI0011E9F3E5|nr:uncharacterized protein LOC115783906 [Archocentrus centrarchus]